MAEKYYQFLSDLTESCGAYRVAPVDDTLDATYHSKVGVPTPHANDFLIVSDSGKYQMYRPSDPDVFADIHFEHFPALEQLLENGALHELTPAETQNFQSLRVSIGKVNDDLHTVNEQMTALNAADSANSSEIMSLIQQEIDLRATLHRLQLGLQSPQSILDAQHNNAVLMQAMQQAGFRHVPPAVMATDLRFENPRTGQLHTFDSAQQAQDFLHKRSLAVTLYFRHTSKFTEEVPYFAGEETAALDAYRNGIDDFGVNAVDYRIEPDAAYDHVGYQFLCAYADAYGYAPNRSEIEYISHREMRRMELDSTSEISNNPLRLEPTEIAALSYNEPSGEKVELHFTQHEADTAVFALRHIMEQGQTPDILVADTAPALDYALYQAHCEATGVNHPLSEQEFMNRYHQPNGQSAPLSDAHDDLVGEGVGFERIRRITGYLVGDLDRFNNAKRAEVRDRVAHDTSHAPAISRPAAHRTAKDGPEL